MWTALNCNGRNPQQRPEIIDRPEGSIEGKKFLAALCCGVKIRRRTDKRL
ncbi:hypothetical protein QGN17_00945 [Sphingomonas sp. MAHUQ-71]|jgi:hypothetical protein|uniref:Uncharacterized protein n=1 Tax=Sphingomonas oryzagri TaxID=3042314 RepID=A0ABT6MWB1_9SPHN|nr:hypothetical protein [Sphingomonas oryzagri]